MSCWRCVFVIRCEVRCQGSGGQRNSCEGGDGESCVIDAVRARGWVCVHVRVHRGVHLQHPFSFVVSSSIQLLRLLLYSQGQHGGDAKRRRVSGPGVGRGATRLPDRHVHQLRGCIRSGRSRYLPEVSHGRRLRGGRVPGHARVGGDLGARKSAPWRCKLCSRGYEWLWHRDGHTCASAAMIKCCGAALIKIAQELQQKNICPAASSQRAYQARRMVEQCPWLAQMGLGDLDHGSHKLGRGWQTQWADSTASGAILNTTGTSGLPHSVVSRATE